MSVNLISVPTSASRDAKNNLSLLRLISSPTINKSAGELVAELSLLFINMPEITASLTLPNLATFAINLFYMCIALIAILFEKFKMKNLTIINKIPVLRFIGGGFDGGFVAWGAFVVGHFDA